MPNYCLFGHMYLQLQWSEAHIPVSLRVVVCFDSQACLPLNVPGLTELRSPSNELRSEGNIQHSCAYSEGLGRERCVAFAFRCRTDRSLKPAFKEAVCIYKRCFLERFSSTASDGNAKRDIELDGNEFFFKTSCKSDNLGGVWGYISISSANQMIL